MRKYKYIEAVAATPGLFRFIHYNPYLDLNLDVILEISWLEYATTPYILASHATATQKFPKIFQDQGGHLKLDKNGFLAPTS